MAVAKDAAPGAHWFTPPPPPQRPSFATATDTIRMPPPVEADLKLFLHSPTVSRTSSSWTWSEADMVRIASSHSFGSDYTISSATMDITSARRRPSFFDLFVSCSPPRSPIPWDDHPTRDPWLRVLAELAVRICPGCEPSEEKSIHDAAVFHVEAAQKECAQSSLHAKLDTIGGSATPPDGPNRARARRDARGPGPD